MVSVVVVMTVDDLMPNTLADSVAPGVRRRKSPSTPRTSDDKNKTPRH